MPIEKIMTYRTTDGQVFANEQRAETHQSILDGEVKVTENQIKELLNAIVILAKRHDGKVTSNIITEAKQVAEMLVKDESIDDHYREMYYNSNCY